MALLGYNPADTSTDLTTPVGIGNTEAANLILFRENDGANQLFNEPNSNNPVPYSDYTGYMPVNSATMLNNPSRWQPLPVGTGQQIFVTPQWGLVTPFALKSGNQFLPKPGPFLYPSRGYFEQAAEILEISANLNGDTKAIAQYWSDGPGTVTPPGHWNEFAQFVSAQHNYNLDEVVQLFFALNNALLDASIAAWDAKRFYDSIRPISAIRFIYQNKFILTWGPCQTTQTILGQNYQSYIPTPAFPSFLSGHSTFSSAAAAILRCFTGSDIFDFRVIIPAGLYEAGCVPPKNLTLFFKTFSEAAEQAGFSRLLGGIHFPVDNQEGLKLGEEVGCQAFDRATYFINGGDHEEVRAP